MKKLPKLFIFDLDGVITDTAEYHYLAWHKLANKLGIDFDRSFNEQLKGVSRGESLNRILELNESLQLTEEEKLILAEEKNEFYKELVQSVNREGILPGIEKLLKQIREHNLKIALGSASKNAPMLLEKLGLSAYFDYIVDPTNVKGKPDPEIFTSAAEVLSVPYSDCVGMEDAKAGVEAINGAKMFSVGVGSSTYLASAHYLVSRTSQLDFNEIVEQYSKWEEAL